MAHTLLYESFSAKNGAKNTSRRPFLKENFRNSSLRSYWATFKNWSNWYFELSATEANIFYKAKRRSARIVNLWDHSLGLFTILAGERHDAHLTIVYHKGDLSENFKSMSSTICLHCPRNFLFFSADTMTSFNNALVAAPKSTKALSKKYSVLCNHFFFSLFVIGTARDSWLNMSRFSLSKIFSNSANIKGTIGQSVWNITKYCSKIQKFGRNKMCSGVVSIHMTCLRDVEIWIGFPNTWELFWKVPIFPWTSLQHVYLQPIELNRTCWKKKACAREKFTD